MIETERLFLRIIKTADAPFLQRLMNTPKWYKYIGDRNIKNVTDAIEYMNDRMHPDLSVKGFVNHVMVDKTSEQPIGTCSLHNREGVEGLDIGYALLPEFEGMGYASEGAHAMLELAFNVHRQIKVSAITSEENHGSKRVLEKLGFRQEGHIQLPGTSEQICLYVFIHQT